MSEASASNEESAEPAGLDLRGPGWLYRLLAVYLETYDPDRARAAVELTREQFPVADLDELSHQLAVRRLEYIGLRPNRLAIQPELAQQLGDTCTRDELEAVGLLTTGWDILQDIAWLHRNESGPVESMVELLTIMALGFKDYELARELHAAHLEEVSEDRAGEENDPDDPDVAALAARVEAQLAPQGELPHCQAALSIGIGLRHIEARAVGRIASLYYERSAIEEEGIERLHELSRNEKQNLVKVLVYLAWADGKIVKEERDLIEHQVKLAGFAKKTGKRLLALLDTKPTEELLLAPVHASTRRFILEQAILLSLVDDEQDESELELLHDVARELGGTPQELEGIMVEVAAFYERNRDAIRDFGPVSGSLGRLQRLVVNRMTSAVRSNIGKIVTEIKETGELAKLLGAASMRKLTPEENSKVKAQLLDICKTVPALAIFLLPGGGFVLPVLIKLLPFNLLPTAFEANEPERPRIAMQTPPPTRRAIPPTRGHKRSS